MTDTLIYLAAPYAHEDPSIMKERYDRVTMVTAHLMLSGHVVFSPITHNRAVAQAMDALRPEKVHTGWEFWRQFDLPMLRRSNVLYVYMLNGWEKSTGVTAEIAAAKGLDIHTVYIEPKEYLHVPRA